MDFTIRQVVDDITSVLDKTGGLFALCFPCCCDICCLLCLFKRRWHLKRLCKSFNRWHFDKGIYIKLLDGLDYGINYINPDALYVFMNVPKRMEFCAKRGIAFQMPEFLPTPQSKPRHKTGTWTGPGPGGNGCGDGC